MTIRIAAAASVSRARPIPPAQTHGEAFAVVPKWVPAAPYLPTFTPGLIYEFPDTSGMHDILTYEALQIACQREDQGEPIQSRQPDDPGIDPPAMRSAWQDDEPDDARRPAHWAVAWFFIIACPALAVIALWQALPDFWRRS